MAMSQKSALREMKGVLFNIERKSNLAMVMKYINPFFSAQENSYKTWMKFAVANPAIVNRGYMVWQAPNEAGLVTDQDGNIVPPGQTSGSDIMWFSLPKGLHKQFLVLSHLQLWYSKGFIRYHLSGWYGCSVQ
jgi:hypothetical protein